MRRVDRGLVSVPTGLSKTDRNGKTELDDVRDHMASTGPKKEAFEFSAYKSPDVRMALEKLFHGKCAYCESAYATTAPVDIEHYRPKGAVAEDDGHPGYWWLAADWENLLPACIDCNRRRGQATPTIFSELLKYDAAARKFSKSKSVNTGKGDSFPISGKRATEEGHSIGKEGALLLNPCSDDPSKHLRFHVNGSTPVALVYPRAKDGDDVAEDKFPLAKIDERKDIGRHGRDAAGLGLSERGAVSIHVYGLNRLGLVHERTRVLRHLNFLKEIIIELSSMADEIGIDDKIPVAKRKLLSVRLHHLRERIVCEIKEMARDSAPYSMMVRAWIADFRKLLAGH